MDFTLGETQQAVAQAAAEVLGPVQAQPPVRRRPAPAAEPAAAAGASPGEQQDSYDRALWKELGQAGLLALALPEWLGGEGLSVLDVAVLLTEVGRRAAPVPALATLAMGVLPVARCGDRELQQALLPGVAAGETVLTAAVREPSSPMPSAPAVTAADGTVTGVKVGVPYARQARWILAPATLTSGGTGVAVIDPSADGVSVRRTPSSGATPEYTVRLDGAPVARLLAGEAGRRAVTDLYRLTLAGAACLADGALAGALTLTREHVATREQFGRPLAAFQAVAQQAADVYIASRTLHLAALSACWRLETGRDAGDADVAAYWLADAAPRAMRTCHHLHGGTGMDASYPLHRYSCLVKDLVRLIGGAEHRLEALGARAGERRARPCSWN